MKKNTKKNLYRGVAGIAGLYLLTRNVVARPVPQEEIVNGIPKMDAVQFDLMMDDIRRIDGNLVIEKGVLGWRTTNHATIANLNLVKRQLENAMFVADRFTASQMSTMQAALDFTTSKIATMMAQAEQDQMLLEGDSSLSGRMMINGLGRRHSRSISGMKSWSKDLQMQRSDAARNAAIRQQTMRRRQAGASLDLSQPIDTLGSNHPTSQVDMQELGGALVNTRASMRRLL
jgi:hypothetical protein